MNKELPTVKSTKDYKQFRKLYGNRSKSNEHIQQLVESLEANPELMIARPVIVNEKYEVIDGQHTLDAAEAAGMDVWYIIIPGISLAETRVLNSTQKGWRLKDYAESWAKERPAIKRILELHEEYGVAISKLVAMSSNQISSGGGGGGGGIRGIAAIRNGSYTFPSGEVTLMERLAMLEDFSDNYAQWNKDSFVLAINKIIKTDGYNHKLMMERLGKAQIQSRRSWTEHLRDLELIYNQGSGKYVKFI